MSPKLSEISPPDAFHLLHVDNGKACGYLADEWKASRRGQTIAIRSPIDESLVGHVQACDPGEVKEVLVLASQSFQEWNARNVWERANILHKAADLLKSQTDTLVQLLILEIGKTRKEAHTEVSRTCELIHYFAEEGLRYYGELFHGDAFPGYPSQKICLAFREPYGVVVAISPFNYPLNLSASKIAPALITGNAVVFKPALQGSIAALHMVELFRQAGIPPGVLNSVTGTSSTIGEALVTHPAVNLITCTGSTKTGHWIHQKAGIIPILLELGGKDAALVLDDADLALASEEILKGAFAYSGQRCTAIKRVLAFPEAADALVALLSEGAKDLIVGDPREEGTVIGPLISNEAADFVQTLIDDAVAKKAKACVGNKRNGRLLWPTILDEVTGEMRVAWEEPFGPVLPILRVKTIEEAVDLANRSNYGLQSCVFTRDLDKAFYVGKRLEVGTVNVNAADSRGPDHFPFLGIKESGLHTQGVHYSILNMTRTKAITLNLRQP